MSDIMNTGNILSVENVSAKADFILKLAAMEDASEEAKKYIETISQTMGIDFTDIDIADEIFIICRDSFDKLGYITSEDKEAERNKRIIYYKDLFIKLGYEEKKSDAYSKFLVIYNTILDEQELEILEKIKALETIDYNILELSSAIRLQIENSLLNLELIRNPLDPNRIRELNSDIKRLLENQIIK